MKTFCCCFFLYIDTSYISALNFMLSIISLLKYVVQDEITLYFVRIIFVPPMFSQMVHILYLFGP